MRSNILLGIRRPRVGLVLAGGLAVWLAGAPSLIAAPRINKVSLRGLQAGATTSLVVEGQELGPEPRVWFSAPGAGHAIKNGATDARVEIDFNLDAQIPAGIYLLRVASASGISEPVALAVDGMPQMPFSPQVTASNIAMTGALEGNSVLSTSLAGKKGQRVLIEIESRRLGSNLDPVVHVYDARRVQLAWSQGLASIAGDSRCEAVLPADGTYTIEIHDALFRGGSPGFFRLKIGEFHYADLVYPLGAQRGASAVFEFRASNMPAEARATAAWPVAEIPSPSYQPAPWPVGVALTSGSRPAVIISDHAELVEPAASSAPNELPTAPVAVSGCLSAAAEQDRYRLSVTPGAKLRFDVLARRAGSPLDGVLSIQNEQGVELAGNDDRPETCDPGLDFTVPDKVTAVVVVLRDLEARGGPDFIYRISATPIVPDFSLSLSSHASMVPKDGVSLLRVKINRAGYGGPVKLSFPSLPAGVTMSPDEIAAGTPEAFITLGAPGLSPAQSLGALVGRSAESGTSVRRTALIPSDEVNKHQPWMREDLAVAITHPSPIGLAWDPFSSDAALAVATGLPAKFRVNRSGVNGPVRLALLTTQPQPRKRVKVANQDREVDDVERTLRFESQPTIAADQSEVQAKILVPADLARISYDLAVRAELLSADGKNVVASAVSPARRMNATVPFAVELAAASPVEARAGAGATGKLAGKVRRSNGFALPVHITLVGLPKGLDAPSIDVAGDKTDFDVPLAFAYGAPTGDVPNVKLVATSLPDPKNEKLLLRAAEIPLALRVVPGEKPAPEKPLAIFEDQVEFLANLNQGGGQASLIADQKYSGLVSIKVTPDQRFNPALPGLGVKIRERPAAGEFRYLRFAWKKQGGQAICLQLNHDGQWGPAAGSPAKFRYHAGAGGECYGASLAVDDKLPAEFTVVTRDLFADFGEFTLSGIALSAVDGEYGLFDHIYLGTKPEDFELVKPAK